MACRTINLLSRLSNYDLGGEWVFTGYSETFPGIPGAGGSDPGELIGDDPEVDFTGFTEGYYYFTYESGEGQCYASETLVIHVVENGSAGEGNVYLFCVNDTDLVDLFDLLTDADPIGEWQVNEYSPDDPGAAFEDGQLDLSLLSESGTFVFDYVIELEDTPGFDTSNCPSCTSISSVTILVLPPCDAGIGGVYPPVSGTIDLFDFLDGSQEPGGTWTQVEGDDTITITGSEITDIDDAEGCIYTFRYTCGLTGIEYLDPEYIENYIEDGISCENYSEVTFDKSLTLGVTITFEDDEITSDITGCSEPDSYQWQVLDEDTWTDLVGEVGPTLTTFISENFYRLQVTCNGCEFASDSLYVEVGCDCNQLGLEFVFDPRVDCLEIEPTGQSCSPIESDILEMREVGESEWVENDEICGCDFYDFVDVNPTCVNNSTFFTIGFNSPEKCNGNITRAILKYGNSTRTQIAGSDLTSATFNVNKNTWINTYNRIVTLVIRLNINATTDLFQEISFYYNGDGSNGSGCGDITITKLNYPKLYKSIEARRTVTFTDQCEPSVFEDTYISDLNCDNLYVDVFVNPISGCTSGIRATVYNCASPTRQWFRNGEILVGETGVSLCLDSYGFGVYEVEVNGCGCIGNGEITIPGCNTTLSIVESPTGTWTGTFLNCSGDRTWEWQRKISGVWTNQYTVTNSSTTNSYTPTDGGEWRLRVTCVADDCQKIVYFNSPIYCTVIAGLSQVGDELVATFSGCSGDKYYYFERWNGSAWVEGVGFTSSSSSYNYAAPIAALWRVTITCLSNGCENEAQTVFEVSCATSLGVTSSGGLYIATFTGCSGSRNWLWQRFESGSWTTVRNVTNSSGTDNYSPSLTGNYRLIATCIGDGCSNTVYFDYSFPCDVTVSIITSDPLLIANPSGCSGTVFYAWYYRATPGTGSWGSIIGTSSSINTTTFGDGEYKVEIVCGGCEAEATKIYSSDPCDTGVTVDCDSSPIEATPTGCAGGTIIYLWQYSPIGSGWINLGSSSTQAPSEGVGYYRVNVWCDSVGNCPAQATCYYDGGCDVDATISFNSGLCQFTLVLDNCYGTQSIQWQRRDDVSDPWVLIQVGGLVLNQCFPGQYRAIGSCGGCDFESNIITVDEPTCGCEADIEFDCHTGIFTLNTDGCEGYTWKWQSSPKVFPPTWVDEQINGSTFEADSSVASKDVRAVLSKPGCPDVITNIIFVPPCIDVPSISSNIGNTALVLSFTPGACYTWQWEESPDGSLWDIVQEGGNSYGSPECNHRYRIKLFRPMCGPEQISSVFIFTCF